MAPTGLGGTATVIPDTQCHPVHPHVTLSEVEGPSGEGNVIPDSRPQPRPPGHPPTTPPRSPQPRSPTTQPVIPDSDRGTAILGGRGGGLRPAFVGKHLFEAATFNDGRGAQLRKVTLVDIYDLIPTDLNIYDALDLLRPVAVYIGGMTVYAVFVFTFYRFVASRDMFALDLSKYEESRFQFVRSFLQVIMYLAKYIILFPVFAFFWFAVVTLILAFLAKDQSFSQVLLMGLATVGTIRVSAYINEDLSRDLAKMLPFAVLGLFLINTSFFQIEDSLVILNESMTYLDNILYYLAFLIALEFALRLIMAILMFVIAMTKLIFRKPVPAASNRT